MNPFRFANVLKIALVAGAGIFLMGCAHDHYDHHDYSDRCDDHELVVVRDHRYDRPYYHEHDYERHHGGYYAERDAYHGDHRDRH